jgi:hypothetical protein
MASPSRWLAAATLAFLGCGDATNGATPASDASTTTTANDASVTDSAANNDVGDADDTGLPLDNDAGSIADSTASADAAMPFNDVDQDGIDDAVEDSWASDYFPYLSIHPSDGCPTHGLLVRVSPHPTEKGRVMIWYDVLYNDDCGANGHVGDDEVFGVVIDPTKPAPGGILAERAISHQGTLCEQTTTCGQCTGMTACATATRNGKAYPLMFPSKDKHGNYADQGTCNASIICDFGGCALSAAADAPPFVNAGEPGHPRVTDLTAQGFVTTANGWTHPELMGFNPWTPGTFGGAGDVSMDLVDQSYVVDTTACP